MGKFLYEWERKICISLDKFAAKSENIKLGNKQILDINAFT